MNFDELYKAMKEDAGRTVQALGKLKLEDIRDLIGEEIDPDMACRDSAEMMASVMQGKKTVQVVASALRMMLISLDLISKDVIEIPKFTDEGESK